MGNEIERVESGARLAPEKPIVTDTQHPVVSHCGIVAVVGRTNAGKSTLVNYILGEKVSIVTPVAQTSRSTIRGVLTDERGQLVLLDTPGLHQSRSKLTAAMNRKARAAIEGVDAVLLVVDAARPPQMEDDGWMRRLSKLEVPCFILLNKIDAGCLRSEFEDNWRKIQEERGGLSGPEVEWLEVSAATGTGVAELVDRLFSALPSGPLLFDSDTISDHPRKLAIADIVQEKFFLLLDDELPHSLGVRVDKINEGRDGWDVDVTLFVQRHSQKGIVLGAKGRRIRAVRRQAEPEIGALYDVPVRLHLWVRVERKWDENYFLLRELGYIS